MRLELANASLKARLSRIERLSSERKLPQDVIKELGGLLRRVRSIAKGRNLAAHNAPMGHVYQRDDREIEVRWEVRGANDPRREVTFELLQKWFDGAVTLDHELALFYGRMGKALSA